MIESVAARFCALAASIAPFGAREWVARGEVTVALLLLIVGGVCLFAGYAIRTGDVDRWSS